MYMNGSPEVRYRIINETISRDDNLLNISYLCQIAGVSRSGFYYWRSHHSERTAAEEADRRDFDLIVVAYNFRGYSKGARGIHMRLLHQDPPVLMNTKKIRRLMKKYHLACPVRKVNPYRKQGKRLQENRTAPNILNRQFRAFGPRTVLLTDITYIPRPAHRESSERAYYFSYVCVIMDAFTKEVLACSCSSSCDTDFVLEAVNQLMEKHGSELKTDALIHSDQGCQYTSSKFVTILNDYNLRQSMSRRGNCWDNAPQESLFGHMKDELPAVGSYGHTVIAERIYAWIDYYNNDRYQWSLAKLSPCEYYKFVTTGIYPLPTFGGAAPKPPEFTAFISGEGKEKDEAEAPPSLQT